MYIIFSDRTLSEPFEDPSFCPTPATQEQDVQNYLGLKSTSGINSFIFFLIKNLVNLEQNTRVSRYERVYYYYYLDSFLLLNWDISMLLNWDILM